MAEKIESILARNISNTRARDFYDVYILLTTHSSDINIEEMKYAIKQKAKERNSIEYINNCSKYITEIKENRDILKIWNVYKGKNEYARDIEFKEIIGIIEMILL